MKRIIFRTLSLVLVFIISVTASVAQSSSSRPSNSISGFVFDSMSRNPISEVYVELMNDTYSTLRRVKTDGTGRFSFNGLSSGTFVVKVSPYGTNYLEETQSATIVNNNIGGAGSSDSVYLDIYLRLDKRKINNEFHPAGAVFIQEIPPAAKDFYKKAIIQLEKSKQTNLGLENLKKPCRFFLIIMMP